MSGKDNKPEMQQIELSKLSLQQLTQLKKQLDQDLTLFQDSLQTLKIAQTKFKESKESLEKIKPNSKGNRILVPLTGSMFVPGVIADAEKVIIDIGTGYYVRMDMASAIDYFNRRVTYLTEQMDKVQSVGIEKTKIREVIMDEMEIKLRAQLAAQRSQTAKT